MIYSKGIFWLEDCRIPFVESDKEKINFDRPRVRQSVNEDWVLKQAHDYTNPEHKEYNQQGRFTPNLLVCDDMLNDGTITKQSNRFYTEGTGGQGFYGVKSNGIIQSGDKGSNSRYYDLDLWFDRMVDGL